MAKGWRKILAWLLVVLMPVSQSTLTWMITGAAANLVVVQAAYAQTEQQIDDYKLKLAESPATSVGVPIAVSGTGANEECVLTSRQCVDGPATKNVGGQQVYRACWQYDNKFACTSKTAQEDQKCADLRADGCYETRVECGAYSKADPSQCVQWSKVYKCPSANPDSTSSTSCAATGFCMDGNCFANDYEANSDFSRAAATLEMARQAGKYLDPATMTLFRGDEESCREGWGGIRKCCEKKVKSGQSNMMVAQSLGISALWQGAKFGWDYMVTNLSPYVYDAMYQSGLPYLMDKGFEGLQMIEWQSWSEVPPTTSFTPSLSYAGVTVSYGPLQAGTGGVFETLTGPGSQVTSVGDFNIYFNPYMFALFVAIMIFQMLSSCEPDEMILSIKRGEDLCYSNGSECSTDTWFGCVETRFKFCCFNSRLARIVNEQGRAQLGKPTPSDCGGFTINDFNAIDFSQIDLAEFYNELVPDSLTKQSTLWTERAKTHIDAGSAAGTPNLKTRPTGP